MHPPDMPPDAREAAERLGGHECACCPTEVRGLYAIAFNITRGTGLTRERLQDLREAVDKLQPMMDAHFAATNGVPHGHS